jgi:hypothetical protein
MFEEKNRRNISENNVVAEIITTKKKAMHEK